MTSLSAFVHHSIESPRIRHLLAVFLGLHAVAHLVGTAGSIQAIQDGDLVPYLGWDVGNDVILAGLAGAWALVAVVFVVAAWFTWTARSGWFRLLVGTAVVSLILSVAASPAAVIGVAVNAALLFMAWYWRHDIDAVGR